jgi:hypothetical protein
VALLRLSSKAVARNHEPVTGSSPVTCDTRPRLRGSTFRYDTIRLLERLSDQLFTFLPERLGIARIERILPYSFADSTDGHVVRNNVADVAVLAVTAADLLRWSSRALLG